MAVSEQIIYLLIIAIPIACIAWTVTREEIFKEPRAYCTKKSKCGRTLLTRKFYYLFTCEYCFSHYVTIAFLCITNFQLLYEGWRGYLIAGFTLVWIANVYMSIFGFIRVGMKKEKMDADLEELKLKKEKDTIT